MVMPLAANISHGWPLQPDGQRVFPFFIFLDWDTAIMQKNKAALSIDRERFPGFRTES
jgi:hypothetical protein